MSEYSKDQNQFRHLWMEGYDFHLGSYVREGFRLLKAYPFGFLGHILLSFMAISLVGIFSFVAAGIAIAAFEGGFGTTSILGLISFALVNWFVSAFFYSFLAGIFYVAKEYNTEQRRSFDSFFKGFNHFGQIFLYTATYGLITFIISMAAMKIVNFEFPIPNFNFDELASGDPESIRIVAETFAQQMMEPAFLQKLSSYSGLAGLLSLYFSVSWSFTLPMITLKDMRFWEAMESSRKIITRKWFNFLGFYVVVGVLLVLALIGISVAVGFLTSLFDSEIISVVLGLLVFFVVMLSIPYVYLAQYAAFEDIVMAEEGYEGMIDDIGSDEGADMGEGPEENQ